MTRAELEILVEKHGLKIDGSHTGAGKFIDVYIGTGAAWPKLVSLRSDLLAAGLRHAKITSVTNDQHPDHGKPMVEIPSFWNE